MPNVVLVVTATLIMAGIGMVGTGEAFVQIHKHEQGYQPPVDNMKDAASRMFQASQDLGKRQTYAIIGGCAGAAVGMIGSILFLRRRDRKLAAAAPSTSDE